MARTIDEATGEIRDLTIYDPAGHGLAPVVPDSKLELLKRTIARGVSDEEFDLFVAVCNRTGLDPFAKQIYAIARYDSRLSKNVMAIQVGIDGFRLQAQRSGEFMGEDGPYWCGEDGAWTDVWLSDSPPAAARVGVRRRGSDGYTYGVATYREYCQRTKEGKPMGLWASMPANQLAKCFSPDTEALTDRGFQRFSEVTGRILQVTAHGLEATDARPFRQEWAGNMVTLDSDDLNFSVTPNHDMVTTEGRIEAGAMFARAKVKPKFWIPRCVSSSSEEASISDQLIRLGAAYLADGQDTPTGRFRIEVSRPRKVEALREIGGYEYEQERHTAGDIAHGSVRTIKTIANKTRFVYGAVRDLVLCETGKRIRTDQILGLSRRQARVFVDALIDFDGSKNPRTGVRRFYSSRPDHIEAFEVAACIAGYAVSPRRARTSDISTKPNYNVTISGRSEIPVIRWGAPHGLLSKSNAAGRTGLEITANESGEVWCVTVPSGEIIVRRNGFSMVCGNCAEAQAIRKLFPAETANIQVAEELSAPDLYEAELDAKVAALNLPKGRAAVEFINSIQDDSYADGTSPPRPATLIEGTAVESKPAEAESDPPAAESAEVFVPCTAEQKAAIERLSKPSQVKDIDWEKLSKDDAGVMIQGLQP